ncbi:MAG: 3'(2'),5'-bisphosphate nucleotidase CysQ [Alphaproteobacteria bacterium]|nr:3'(2'),5'-bisphosphate nucleotidase CysQ [Alphaproteobacteria bacterium]
MTVKPDDICDKKDTHADEPSAESGGFAADRALLSTAIAEAGEIARHYFQGDAKPRYKGPGQIVTEADIAIDRLLHDRLIGSRPGDGWLSEERDDDGSRSTCRRVWFIDPIDGTRSFAAGIGEFTISAALVIDDAPVIASVYNPITSEHFQALKGNGATLNGKPLVPSVQASVEGASLLASSGEMKKRRWPEFMPDAAFTTIGSLAYKLALVAAGRYSGLVSLRSCHDWDIAAAALLLEESGAWLGDGEGRPIRLNQSTLRHGGLVAAGAEPLYNALVSRLATIVSSER